MSKILRDFSKSMLATVRDKVFDVSNTIANMDFDATFASVEKQLNIAAQKLNESAQKLNKHIHTYFDTWSVDIDFDIKEEMITSEIKDNTLLLTVKNEATNSVKEFSTTIPEDVDIKTFKQYYDAEKKKANFVFKKKTK